MSNLRDLLAKANAVTAKPVIRESAPKVESSFDDLDTFIQDISATTGTQNYDMDLSKDGNALQVGDPVVGIHRGQNMSGQVIAVNGNKVTVEWKDHSVTEVTADTLELSNVDDDYIEETMYIESSEAIQTMGFDKESFVEDTDLDSLLRGGASGAEPAFKYGANVNEF